MDKRKLSHSSKTAHEWKEGDTLAQCNMAMLRSELLSDVTFRVGKKHQTVKAHKYMLVSRSEVFLNLLQDNDGEIDATDVEPDVLGEVLKYIYTDDIELDTKNVTAVLYAAKKYGLGMLEVTCLEVLTDGINEDTVCGILEQAHVFNEKGLQDKCLEFIFGNAPRVLKSPGFLDLCARCLEHVIGPDDLRADESRVYEAVVAWAGKQCRRQKLSNNDDNRRRVLGNLKYLIRFPVMDIDYFTNQVSSQAILTKDEKISIFQYLHSRSSPSVAPFKSTRRSITRAIRFEVTSGSWNVGEFSDAIQFQASRDIFLDGVVLFGCCRGSSEYYVIVRLTGDDQNKVLAERELLISTDYKTDMYDVPFIQSVRLKAQTWYTVVAEITGPNTKRGIQGRDLVYCEQLQFVFKTSGQGKNCTTVKEGQIPGLLFHD